MQLRKHFSDRSPSLLPSSVLFPPSPSSRSESPFEEGSVVDPGSPSLAWAPADGADGAEPSGRDSACSAADPVSPSATFNVSSVVGISIFNMKAPLAAFPQDDASTEHQGSQRSFTMKKASCQRASRAARASNPSSEATMNAYNAMYRKFQSIRSKGIERAPKESQAFKSFKPASGSGGKGAAVRTSAIQQNKMNHLASLKAKDIDTNNTEPAFLLGGFTTPMLWDRLAENSLKSNAVNSSVMNRKKTQGAANQTTRISCKSIGQAAAAQVCATALAMAQTRYLMRKSGVLVVNPIATNSVNLCGLALLDTSSIDADTFFCITSTARLVYNSNPVKLSSVSVLSIGIELSRRELDHYYISNAMGTHNHMLVDICKSILGENELDGVWCSWVLVNYLCSHPRGRDILKATGLTDVDVQSAIAFERYGGEEIRRRVRQRKSAQAEAGKRPRRPGQSKAGPSSINDDDEDEDDGAVSGKKRRGMRGSIPSATSDSHSILDFWHGALRSTDVSVLHTLAAQNKRTVRDAALSTLARQAEGTDVADNIVLQNVSLANAIKSAQALVSFVGRRVDDIPAIVMAYVPGHGTGKMRMGCGMLRINKEGASSALHSCTLPPLPVRPDRSTGIAIAWSHASKKLMPSNEDCATLPSILERYDLMEREREADKKAGGSGVYSISARTSRTIGHLEAFIDSESEMSIGQCVTGTARSFLSIASYTTMNSTHFAAASSMLEEAKKLHATVAKEPLSQSKLPCLLGKSQLNDMRIEPLSTPSCPLAVGICVNEMMRRWMAGKTRKNDPCKKHLGFSAPSEVSKDMPGIMSSEPLPMLTITDIGIERTGEPRSVAGNLSKASTCMGIHVCGDGAVRVPELLEQLRSLCADDAARLVRESRAALFVSASQASFIGVVGSSLTSGYTNASVASSKKISCPDVNKIMFLSPFDCYAAGLCNIQRSFDPGPYSGTYGCRLDTGFTMHGLFAHNFRSDNRQHGNCCLSEAAADELAMAFGESHWIVYDDPIAIANGTPPSKYYTATPICTRGIPHNFTPGLHSLLNDYCSFLESYRTMSDREGKDTVDSIMCLPFSPFTQALNPDLEPTADVSLRTCFRDQLESSVSTGRGYLPDATAEADAIATEPLFRRPCQVTSGDCPFANSYEAVDTFFNACNTLALLARSCTRAKNPDSDASDCIATLHATIDKYVNGEEGKLSVADSAWAADALVLLNVLYPCNVNIAEFAIMDGIAKGSHFCQKAMKSKHPTAFTIETMPCIQNVDVRMVRMFWSSFCRPDASKCAWKWGVAPFLTLILQNNGSHKTTPETIAQFRNGLETAVRAVWLVYSPDGVSPPPDDHPASTAASPAHIARHHIDPVFVGNQSTGLWQRGAAIGMKPHSYRQVLAELLGASIDGVECNVALNEGGLSLRVSSDPTILEEHGKERTDKAISPVQTEGDESAYGSREDKIEGAVAQKEAWDRNALLCKPLYTAIEPPRHTEIRGRGEFGFSQFFQAENAKMASDGQRMSESFAHAKHLMVAAADPVVARRVEEALARGVGGCD